jgi:hypothetical protein
MDAKVVNLITSIRQPIHGPHPLIGRSSTSVNWILFFVFSHPSVAIPSILDDAGRNPFSKIPSDDGCAAVRERLKFW